MKATVTQVTKRIEVKKRTFEGIFSYDRDNNNPGRVVDIVMASTMGKSCWNIYRKFIFGKGFASEAFAATKLNRWGDTSDKVLECVAKDYASFGGFAVHVNYNANFEITDITYHAFDQIRITTSESKNPGMYAVYKDWSERNIKRDNIKYIDKFNPDPVTILAQVEAVGGWNNYKGQILYYSNQDETYPLPVYDAGLEDMQTDAQAKTYKFRNITSNFMASHMVIVDKMESTEVEDDGDARGADTEKQALIEGLEEYQGADNAQKLLLIEKTHPDQTIEIKKIDQQAGDKLFEWTENSTRDNIRQSFFIPPVLLMQTPGKMGTADEIIDATKYYNSITEDERLTIEATFEVLAGYYVTPLGDDFSVAPREAIRKEDIPATILPDLTKNERRALAGYPEIVEGSTQTLAERLQVGGTQSLIGILNDPAMSDDKKRGALKVLFALPDDQIITLIPLTQPTPANVAVN